MCKNERNELSRNLISVTALMTREYREIILQAAETVLIYEAVDSEINSYNIYFFNLDSHWNNFFIPLGN